MHDIELSAFELPTVEQFLAGDSRELAFRVVDDDGTGVDIQNATVEWRLFERDYESADGDAILTSDDSGVELVTDSRVDSAEGEFEVRLSPAATEDRWGSFWQRPEVTVDGDAATWRGEIVLTA